MNPKLAGVLRLGIAVGLCLAVVALFADPPAQDAASSDGPADTPEPLTVEQARGQARLLHRTYEATLLTMHRRYFDEDERHTIPARALEDIFEEVDADTGRTTRWIAVNSPAMNVDHEPRDGFEKRAAEALTDGAEEFELVENGVYHRAGAVKLVGSCLKCHVSGLTKQVKTQRVAGLVVSMPVRQE